jgi:hypothetical protein
MRTLCFAVTLLLLHAPAGAEAGGDKEALDLAVDAYVYGYPLVTMEYTRRVVTNVASPKGARAPMGRFADLRRYPDYKFRDVTAPNADTLYSSAFLDLSKEPYLLSLPDEDGRYFLMPMLDGWTEVFTVPGKRTTGTKAQNYAITGPGWKGKLPEGFKELKSRTSMVWILGRTYCTGSRRDYRKVHALQDQYRLIPLSAHGKKDYVPPEGKVDPSIDMKTPVRDQVDALKGGEYFALLAKLMKDNPPTKADAPMVAKLAKLGVVPGKAFEPGKYADAAAAAPKAAQKKIMGHFKKAGKGVNGWVFTTKTGRYGIDYLQRALVTAVGLGANRPEDAVYPTAEKDADGKAFDGANKYTITFPKGQMPPVNGFWSVTMYDGNYFFTENSLNRYTLSQRDELVKNEDGSTTLYLQHESPGKDKEANWLPAPKGKFILMMRLYWPKEKAPSILDGSWKIPGVKKAG